MKTTFFPLNHVRNEKYEIAIIFSTYEGKMVFVKNRGRQGWEMPGGHREKDENINMTASRELSEETGATLFGIKPLCDYSVTLTNLTSYGRLFYAAISEMKPISDSEVEEVGFFTQVPTELMFKDVQEVLLKKALSIVNISNQSH